jgi:hypothetical protein
MHDDAERYCIYCGEPAPVKGRFALDRFLAPVNEPDIYSIENKPATKSFLLKSVYSYSFLLIFAALLILSVVEAASGADFYWNEKLSLLSSNAEKIIEESRFEPTMANLRVAADFEKYRILGTRYANSIDEKAQYLESLNKLIYADPGGSASERSASLADKLAKVAGKFASEEGEDRWGIERLKGLPRLFQDKFKYYGDSVKMRIDSIISRF